MASKRVRMNKKISPQKASRWIGHPVYVILNDGRYYMGMVTGVEKGKLFLSGAKGRGKLRSSVRTKRPVKVSGFMGSLLRGGRAFNPLTPNAGGAFKPFAAGLVGGGQSNPGQGSSGFFGRFRQLCAGFQLRISNDKNDYAFIGWLANLMR